MGRRTRSPEEQERRAKIRELLGTVKSYAQICLQTLAEQGQPAIETSW